MPTQQPKYKKWHAIADKVVWEAFRAGDHDALECIYNAHVKDLYNYGYQVLPDEALVKDGIQEVFINLWHNRENLSTKVHIKYYLFKALRRQLLKYVAQHSKGQQEYLTTPAENLIWENDHEHHLIKDESSQKKINNLPQHSASFLKGNGRSFI